MYNRKIEKFFRFFFDDDDKGFHFFVTKLNVKIVVNNLDRIS